MTFFQLICGVVVPTLMVAQLHAPLHDAATQEAERQRRRRLQRELSRPPSPEEGEQGAAARLTRSSWPLRSIRVCSAGLAAASLSAEGTLQHLCSLLLGRGPDRVGAWVLGGAVWWLLLSLCWVLALALELAPVAARIPAAA